MPLYGRDPELAALHALTEASRQSRSGVLVLRGAPGTGKSALLEEVAASSADMRVLRATGIQGEAELAFAGLHQLVWPLRNLIGQLADAQAAVLHGVLGAAEGRPAGRFLVGAATLELLAAAAEERPLLSTRAPAASVSRPRRCSSVKPDPSNAVCGPSRRASTSAIGSTCSLRAAKMMASADGPSSQCASSTRASNGRSSPAAASNSRVAAPTWNWPGNGS